MSFLLSSCVRQSEMQTEGVDFLQGIWIQDSIPLQDQMLHYTLHEFKITCDSLYVTFRTNAKTKQIADSCYGDGQWDEYAKGVYVLREDSIIVEGLFTKPNWKQKISGCHRNGPFVPRYKLVYHDSDSVVLESRFDQRPIILRKTQDITCVPKKRWEY